MVAHQAPHQIPQRASSGVRACSSTRASICGEQAFARVARPRPRARAATAARAAPAQSLRRRFVLRAAGQAVDDRGQVGAQVAVVLDVADDRVAQRAQPLLHVAEVPLLAGAGPGARRRGWRCCFSARPSRASPPPGCENSLPGRRRRSRARRRRRRGGDALGVELVAGRSGLSPEVVEREKSSAPAALVDGQGARLLVEGILAALLDGLDPGGALELTPRTVGAGASSSPSAASSVTLLSSSCAMRSSNWRMGIWRDLHGLDHPRASFICWLMRMCCDASKRIGLNHHIGPRPACPLHSPRTSPGERSRPVSGHARRPWMASARTALLAYSGCEPVSPARQAREFHGSTRDLVGEVERRAVALDVGLSEQRPPSPARRRRWRGRVETLQQVVHGEVARRADAFERRDTPHEHVVHALVQATSAPGR